MLAHSSTKYKILHVLACTFSKMHTTAHLRQKKKRHSPLHLTAPHTCYNYAFSNPKLDFWQPWLRTIMVKVRGVQKYLMQNVRTPLQETPAKQWSQSDCHCFKSKLKLQQPLLPLICFLKFNHTGTVWAGGLNGPDLFVVTHDPTCFILV